MKSKLTFKLAQKFLFDHIPASDTYKYPGEMGLRRQRKLLELLGSPQNKVRVIHVAGTSGKGSTSFLISKILRGLGFKTGLALSPHLTDIRERFQINNALISKEQFCTVLQSMMQAINKTEEFGMGKPTYFEILVALAFYLFALEKVDYAVIETGLGGWLDGTNVVDREDKVAVITQIGHDHVKLLGKTLDKIALHKAKIINEKNRAFSISQHQIVKNVFDQQAKSVSAKLSYVEPTTNFKFRELNSTSTVFDFSDESFSFPRLTLGMIGKHQMENASLALSVVGYLSKRDNFDFNEAKIREVLKSAKFPGRFDTIDFRGRKLIIDGAHNVQKMNAFLRTLGQIYEGQKFNFVLAFKKDKDVSQMLKMIAPMAKKIIFTSFLNQKVKQGFSALSMSPEHLKEVCVKNKLSFEYIPESQKAIEKMIEEQGLIVITGSLYLVGEVYDYLHV